MEVAPSEQAGDNCLPAQDSLDTGNLLHLPGLRAFPLFYTHYTYEYDPQSELRPLLPNRIYPVPVDPPLSAAPQDIPAHQHGCSDYRLAVMESDEYDSVDSFDNVQTIAPARLELGEDFDEDPDDYELAYGVLEFPDTNYFIKEPSLILGRDTKLQRWLDQNLQQPNLERARQHQEDPHAPEDRDPERTPSTPTSPEEIPQVSGGLAMRSYDNELSSERLPNGVVFLPIHCPIDNETGAIPNLNAISKMHVQLDMHEYEGWHLSVLGRNGVLVNDEYYDQECMIQLEDGDKVQISDLVLYFRCPDALAAGENDDSDPSQLDEEDVAPTVVKKRKRTTTDAEEEEPAPKKPLKIKLSMKRDEPAIVKTVETPPKASAASATPAPQTSATPAPASAKDAPPAVSKETSETALVAPDESSNPKKVSRSKYPDDPSVLLRNGEIPPAKRGPGRPPKNGVMSKREMKERLKAQEEDLRREFGEDAAKQMGAHFGKAGLDDKKKKQRRRSDNEDGKKDKDDGPREPSPKMEDYTAQQLEKPNATYAELLYPLLQETGPLSLQEIYRHFERRWPYYKFGCKGTGWQSSIRHTVNTNVDKGEAHFVKDQKDGKGYKWAANLRQPVTQKPARVSNPAPAHPQTYQGQPAGHPPYQAPPYAGAPPPGQANVQYQQRPPYYQPPPNGPYQQTAQYRPNSTATPQQQQPHQGAAPPTHGARPQQYASQQYQQQQARPGQPDTTAGAPQQTPHAAGAGQPPHPNSQTSHSTHTQPNTQAPQSTTQFQQRPHPPTQTPQSGVSHGHPSATTAPPPPNTYPSAAPRPAVAGVPSGNNAGPPSTTQAPRSGTSVPSASSYAQGPAGRPPSATASPAPSQPPLSQAGVATRPANTQMPPVEQWSGLELLMRGKYPAVFDQFKVAFVDGENDEDRNADTEQRSQNRMRRARVFGKMVSFFMMNKTIEKDPPPDDSELVNIYKVVKEVLLNEHKSTIRKRSSQAGGSRPSTPAAASPIPRSVMPTNRGPGTPQPPVASPISRTVTPAPANVAGSSTAVAPVGHAAGPPRAHIGQPSAVPAAGVAAAPKQTSTVSSASTAPTATPTTPPARSGPVPAPAAGPAAGPAAPPTRG